MRRVNPVVLVLVAIASVQLGAAMAKGVFDAASPGLLALTRVAIASVVFLAIARPRFTGRSARDWLVALGYGVCLVGMNVAIYYSFARIPIGVAVTVEFIGPLALAVLGSRRLVDLVWVGFAAAGVLLLGALPSSADLLGLLLALVAGVFWAGYIVLAGPLGRRWEGISGVAAGSMLGTLLLAAPVLLTADGGIGTPGVWLTMAAVALLSSVVPYGLEVPARRSITASTFGILMSLEPAAAALFAWMVLGERLGWVEWLAMACVIVASVGAIRTARRRSGQEAIRHARAEGA